MTTSPTSIEPVFVVSNPDTEPSDAAIRALAVLLVDAPLKRHPCGDV